MKIKTRTPKISKSYETPKWKLGYLEVAGKEGRKLLSKEQYAHAVQLVEDLAYEDNPTKSETQDVRDIDEFYELRDKGGILGRINLRIYFTLFEKRKLIFVLMTYKKEDDGQVPRHVVIRVRNRLRIAREELVMKTQKG
ncbi:MAG: hypothetical protein PVH77_09690 [Phycisphaerales bacterium]|jgi:hypothetical protein